MNEKTTPDITQLLQRWGTGDAAVLGELMPVVYEQLRLVARQRLRTHPDASINTTALVHEAYLRLAGSAQVDVHDRHHFLALASRVMRHVLVDQARARNAVKRGLGATPVGLRDDDWITDQTVEAVTRLDEALKRLETVDERRSRILEQRYFGGLTLEEIAGAIDISLATVKRELRSARAWLALELGGETP